MKYQIIEASTPAELEKNVRREIEQAWEPQGGISARLDGRAIPRFIKQW